ncbi:hypothetical protein MKW98_006393 [Papaver atlanticum]|uniref:tRNA:m(4)X modification enzyme TRM13 n=1 Tax=Papaver atlanticum TaxID=357466 RepID=A0AAD4RUW1_9MAGN|nr:hypothetical protein MKW98_006393 [Papaver atlanticum]
MTLQQSTVPALVVRIVVWLLQFIRPNGLNFFIRFPALEDAYTTVSSILDMLLLVTQMNFFNLNVFHLYQTHSNSPLYIPHSSILPSTQFQNPHYHFLIYWHCFVPNSTLLKVHRWLLRKHLCGPATDLTLKCCLPRQTIGALHFNGTRNLRGLAIATCCRHLYQYKQYISYLQSCHPAV